MQTRQLTAIRKVVNRIDKRWRKFVHDVNTVQPQSHAGAPTRIETQQWLRLIKRWCDVIDYIRPRLDEIYKRICDDLVDADETESGD